MAQIFEPRVRETSITENTGEIVLLGAMRGSLAFAEVMAVGDTCDVVVSYDNAFQEFVATLNGSGHLQRTTTIRSRHANGTVDQSDVSFAPGVKTVIMTFSTARAANIGKPAGYDDASVTLAKLDPAAVSSIVASAVAASWRPGDARLTYRSALDAGEVGIWVIADDGTIGNAGSGATTYANALAANLYTVLWNNISNTFAPVTGGRGLNAALDFAALKPMGLSKLLGRTLAIAGAGSGLTSRALGQILGEEAHALTQAELSVGLGTALTSVSIVNGNNVWEGLSGGFNYGGTGSSGNTPSTFSTILATATTTITNPSGGNAHNNMPPTSFLNAWVKL